MFNKIPKALRLFFIIMAGIISLGIFLTGYQNVHWVSFLPPVFLAFAAITGICPGMFITKKIVGD